MVNLSELIYSLTLIFAASSILLSITKRFSHPSIPAYIAAGIAISGFLNENALLELSQIGIAFLVFIFGLRTEPERIKSVARESLATTIVQLTVVGAAAYIIAEGFGFNLVNTIILVLAASISSSLVGLQLIESEIRINLLHGRLSESIHLIQDVFAMALILVAAHPSVQGLPVKFGHAALIILLGLLTRRYLLPAISRQSRDSTELTMLTGIALLTGFVGLSQLLEVSIVIGAFAAGLAAARFPYNLEIMETLSPMKDFFSAVLFVALGALISLPGFETALLSAFLITSTLALKPLITIVSLLISGYDRRTSYLSGFSLDQISEFALIAAIQAYIAGTVMPELFNAVIISSAATMIISAYTTRHVEKLYSTISRFSTVTTSERKIHEWTEVPDDISDHVILIGYDAQGKRIAEALRKKDQKFVIMENDPEKIFEAREKEQHYVFGDVMDRDTWRKIKPEDSRLLISTIPLRKVSLEILKHEAPETKILRSESVEDAAELLEKGATYVEVPDIVASEELIDHLEGVFEDINYREELRRRNLLELRNQLQEE